MGLVLPLKPFFAFEIDRQDDRDQHHQSQGIPISVFPVDFRHEFEIHPIKAGNERQRDEESRNDGQDFHDFIHFDRGIG
jgi:hypothetical protein